MSWQECYLVQTKISTIQINDYLVYIKVQWTSDLTDTFDIYIKFITLIKYSKTPKVLTNITHRFIALSFVKMLPVIYKKHEKVNLTLRRGTLLLCY